MKNLFSLKNIGAFVGLMALAALSQAGLISQDALLGLAFVGSIAGATTQETLDLMKGALNTPNDDISKSITTGTGLVAYDLQAPAKNLYPVQTPLRNRIPRVGPGTGVATNWRVVRNIIGSGFDNTGWVPEGQRSGRMSYSTYNKAANYVTLGEEDSVTFEAVNAGKTFEDLRASMSVRLLQKMMLKEEIAILGGNTSLSLGTASTPTASAAGSGATLPAATYSVIVVALTLEGYLNSSLSSGVATTMTVAGADGGSYTIKGGSSNKSAAASQAITLGQTLSAVTAVVNGAVGYAWFVGTAGAEKLEKITTINSATFSAPLAGTGQAATAITADNSANTGTPGFDGLLTTAFLPGSSAVVTSLATGTAGTGTPLTGSGRGSVVEIDAMLQAMWDQYQLGATVIYVNSQELKNITTKVIGTGNAALVRWQGGAGAGSDPFQLTAGGTISFYFNPFTPDGGKMIPVRIHPKVPPGTILAYCEDLPITYQNNQVQNVAEIKTRMDYYQIDWPVRSRQYETGVYSEQVLAVYAPFAMAVLTNIANG